MLPFPARMIFEMRVAHFYEAHDAKNSRRIRTFFHLANKRIAFVKVFHFLPRCSSASLKAFDSEMIASLILLCMNAGIFRKHGSHSKAPDIFGLLQFGQPVESSDSMCCLRFSSFIILCPHLVHSCEKPCKNHAMRYIPIWPVRLFRRESQFDFLVGEKLAPSDHPVYILRFHVAAPRDSRLRFCQRPQNAVIPEPV